MVFTALPSHDVFIAPVASIWQGRVDQPKRLVLWSYHVRSSYIERRVNVIFVVNAVIGCQSYLKSTLLRFSISVKILVIGVVVSSKRTSQGTKYLCVKISTVLQGWSCKGIIFRQAVLLFLLILICFPAKYKWKLFECFWRLSQGQAETFPKMKFRSFLYHHVPEWPTTAWSNRWVWNQPPCSMSRMKGKCQWRCGAWYGALLNLATLQT